MSNKKILRQEQRLDEVIDWKGVQGLLDFTEDFKDKSKSKQAKGIIR